MLAINLWRCRGGDTRPYRASIPVIGCLTLTCDGVGCQKPAMPARLNMGGTSIRNIRAELTLVLQVLESKCIVTVLNVLTSRKTKLRLVLYSFSAISEF